MQQFFIDDPIGAATLIFIAIMVGVSLERARASAARREWRAKKGKRSWSAKTVSVQSHSLVSANKQGSAPDAAAQLRTVMESTFTKRTLLNRSELRVFAALERELGNAGCDGRLMAQVSLGEILGSDNKDAYFAINAKRVDFLLVDPDGLPLHVIEYQGAGHYRDTAAARDAIKKEALRKAGIGYFEVVHGDRLEDLRALVAKIIRPAESAVAYPVFGKK